MMDFVAIDFETANNCRTSACQVGIAVVEQRKIAYSKSWLIKPSPNYYLYTDVHRLSKRDTDMAPTFDQVWAELNTILARKMLVAHNVPFDRGVLAHTLMHYGLAQPTNEWQCTLALARRALPQLPNHRLSTIAQHIGIALNHHEAESDALAAAEIMLKLSTDKSQNT